MGDVPVAGFVFDVVLGPLLQVTGFADLEGWELREGGVGADVEIGIRGQGGGAEDFGGLQEAGEDGSGDLDVHGGGHAEVVRGAVGEAVFVFGRTGGAGDEMAGVGVSLGCWDEVVEEEEGVVAEAGIGVVAEEGGVAGVVEVVPEVEGKPGSSHGPDASAECVDGGCVAPDVGVVMGDGAAGFVVALRGDGCGGARVVDEIEEGSVEVGQVGAVGQPVVHLSVDIDGVLGAPGRIDGIVPDALQVGGEGSGARAGDEHVAAVLKVDGEKVDVFAAVFDVLDALVGGGGDVGVFFSGGKEGDFGAAEEALVVGDVAATEVGVGAGAGCGEVLVDCSLHGCEIAFDKCGGAS